MLERISKPDSHDMHNFTGVFIQFQPTEQIFFVGVGVWGGGGGCQPEKC